MKEGETEMHRSQMEEDGKSVDVRASADTDVKR